MSWFVLVLSGVLEAVWAAALGSSRGFRRVVPTIVFVVALGASMLGLAIAMRSIPTGTAYAVWVGIGAVLTVVIGIVRGHERATVARCALLLLLVASVVGLKVVH
jgi:quaternary ammonium compound-resistance protein SugE